MMMMTVTTQRMITHMKSKEKNLLGQVEAISYLARWMKMVRLAYWMILHTTLSATRLLSRLRYMYS